MAISPIGWRCLWLGMVPAALLFCHAALAADAAETAATACLGGVSALYPQHRFTEAAANARLRDRAAAVAAAFGPTEAMLAVGRTFLVVFIVVLGMLTVLRYRIPLHPALTIWAALVVSIIGTFGLRATELLQAINVGPMPK